MQIAIIGCGNMGKALAQRLSHTNQLFLYDNHIEKAKLLAQEGWGKACKEARDALRNAEMIILAVKPQNLKEAVASFKNSLQQHQVIVSLLAGTPVATLRQYFPTAQIIRMMPNLALIHGEAVIGLSSDENLKNEVKELLSKTCEVLGKIYWIPEEKMDALTALASSGPAFFFAMVEAMIDAGIAMGFAAKDAKGLVYQMLQGSLALLEKTDKPPGDLIRQIASPQGTTIAGLRKLEELALRGSIISTFLAAYERACTLSMRFSAGGRIL